MCLLTSRAHAIDFDLMSLCRAWATSLPWPGREFLLLPSIQLLADALAALQLWILMLQS